MSRLDDVTITRVAWGARPPKQTDNTFTKDEGIIVHYSTRDAARLVSHWPDCYESWRNHQRWHMDHEGWWDLAYNFGVCPHGFAFEGRGWRNQNGANTPVNAMSLSICYDGDLNDTPLPVVERTFKDLIDRAVEKGWNPLVRGHGEVSAKATPCPGAAIKASMLPSLKRHAEALAVGGPAIPPPPPPVDPPATTFEKVMVMGPPTTTIAQMQRWARANNGTALFMGLAVFAWQEGVDHGVDPAVVYGIMAHETAFGRFGGVLDVSFHNWGGIKGWEGGGNYDPNAHFRFTHHREGVRAVAQHAGRYAGLELPYPEIVDPRWDRVPTPGSAPSLPDADWSWASDSHDDRVAQHVQNLRRA